MNLMNLINLDRLDQSLKTVQSQVTNLSKQLLNYLSRSGGTMTGPITYNMISSFLTANQGRVLLDSPNAPLTELGEHGFVPLWRYKTDNGVFLIGGYSHEKSLVIVYTSDDIISQGGNAVNHIWNFQEDGTLYTDRLTLAPNIYVPSEIGDTNAALDMNNSNLVHANAIMFGDPAGTFNEGIFFPNKFDTTELGTDWMRIACYNDQLLFTTSNQKQHVVYHDGTTIPTQGADYAELFTWEDTNPNKENRDHLFVSLNGESVHISSQYDDNLIGITSTTPSVIGSAIIDGTDQHLNPSYAVVGLHGKLLLQDDGSSQVNGYVTPNPSGEATHSPDKTRFRVLSRINDHLIKVLIL